MTWNGSVTFVASSAFTTNYTTITVDGTGVKWFGSSSNYIYLDASQATDTIFVGCKLGGATT